MDDIEQTLTEPRVPDGNGSQPEPPQQPEAQEPQPEAPRAKSRRPIKLLLVCAVALFLAIPYWYTAKPTSCTRCHSMQKYYTSWQKSSHSVAAKTCLDCHVKQGTVNLWAFRFGIYREIYAAVAGKDLKPSRATLPGIQSCQRDGCHSLNRMESASGDIKINHKMHVSKAMVPCTTCHPGAAHPNVGAIGASIPTDKICMGCHLQHMSNCSFCHNKKLDTSSGFKH